MILKSIIFLMLLKVFHLKKNTNNPNKIYDKKYVFNVIQKAINGINISISLQIFLLEFLS